MLGLKTLWVQKKFVSKIIIGFEKFSQKNFKSKKNFGSKNNFGSRKILVPKKIFGSKKNFGCKKNLCSKIICKNILSQKRYWIQNILGPNILGLKIFVVQKNLDPTAVSGQKSIFHQKKSLVLRIFDSKINFGQEEFWIIFF